MPSWSPNWSWPQRGKASPQRKTVGKQSFPELRSQCSTADEKCLPHHRIVDPLSLKSSFHASSRRTCPHLPEVPFVNLAVVLMPSSMTLRPAT
jgi:hypothetical protein